MNEVSLKSGKTADLLMRINLGIMFLNMGISFLEKKKTLYYVFTSLGLRLP